MNINKISQVTNKSIKQVTALNSVMKDSSILDKIKNTIRDSSICTIFFVAIFLFLLFSNGYWNTHFDLDSLLTLYGVIYAKQAINFGIDSSLNSPRNESPTNYKNKSL